ncbi:phosphoglycerate dehydrogenase [Hydrogenibacillus schlegelii]|uniref:phosphoglycerate dehydrogenase n=1 Tax=Hydrogenibacillus schlegelii TaxID=1484 RepID=UPI0009E93CB2|nr:phosphoglycerate dehydrogenase [Hydrogenibacillus schlegelii]
MTDRLLAGKTATETATERTAAPAPTSPAAGEQAAPSFLTAGARGPYVIAVADPLSDDGLRALLDADDVELLRVDGADEATRRAAFARADALLVRSQTKVTRELIADMPKLKVIGRAGVGVDNIDLDAATERGVIVLNAPYGNMIAAAEHTLAMMLALARHIPRAHQSLVAGRWDRKAFLGFELAGKTLGIVGLGRIGQEVAKRAKAFEMRVIAYDPYLTEERARALAVEKVSFETLLAEADIITLHTPLTDETRNLIDAAAIARMKDGVRIVNCARGGLIDERALYDALVSGKVAGAALDVFAEEPPAGNPLLDLPNVVVTPHLGASTVEAQELVARDVAQEVLNVLRGRPFKNSVNFPSLAPDVYARLKDDLALADALGRFVGALIERAPTRLRITYGGAFGPDDEAALTRAVVQGFLKRQLDIHVNFVNALFLAKQRRLAVTAEMTPRTEGFEKLLTVEATDETGASFSAAGTVLNGLGPRIVKVDGFSVDVVPRGPILYVHHHDRPGVIGRVGTLLGRHGVNIATMQVGRRDEGGRAIMMLTVDHPPGPDVLADLERLDDIDRVRALTL